MLENQIEFIRAITDFVPDTAIILGSGLAALADEVDEAFDIKYSDIPDFPVSTAPGHKGRLILGTLGAKKVAVFQGRVHLYEGYTAKQAVSTVMLAKLLGAKNLLLTNAAGAVNKEFTVGDFMVVEDHISTFVPSALSGKNDDTFAVRFPDMSEVYSKRLNGIIFSQAEKMGLDLKKGVYIQFEGPNFETPSEIKMAALLGADAVGMSTAIEAQAACSCGLETAAISVISNMACGISKTPITSQEVNITASRVAPLFKELIKKCAGSF